MKHFLLLPFFLLLAAVASAQGLHGIVRQADGKAAGFATVTLHNAADSVLVKGTITGEDGAFELPGVAAGRYFVKANLIGMGQAALPAFDYAGGDYALEPVALQELATDLAEVTVVARRPVVEVRADKTILNVEGTVNSTGLNALELLRKAPGVTVDNNENLIVKGKNAVKILIDGRETPLDGKDLAALLKGMQASDIAAIEVISNPSAKYDAAGNAGIINIRLRKNKSLGTNGNLALEGIYGQTAKAGGNVSLNHRGEKFGAFASYNNHYGDWHNKTTFRREQSGRVFDQPSSQVTKTRWNSARAGVDYFINSKHTVGVLVNGNYDFGDWFGQSRASIGRVENGGAVDSILEATNTMDNDRLDLNGNLNYRYADTSGRSLNIDLDRGAYRIRGESFQPNFYRSADGQTLLNERTYRYETPTDIDIMTVKADYEQPLFKGTFGIGFKVADVETDNTFDVFNVIGGQPVKDLALSNRFVYRERTSAGYVNYQKQLGKLHVQAGLRVENTDYEGDLIAATPQDGESVQNNYTELFPSAALTYKFTEKLGLNATYSRRIDRPSYQDLNPFEFKLDELTFQRGNPMLRPQFTNSVELSPTFGGFPVATFGYSHTRDVFTQILDTRGEDATYLTQENIADQRNYTVTVNAPTKIGKWWDGFVSLTGYRSAFSAQFREGFTVDQTYYAYTIYSEQTIRLPHSFSIQLSGWFNSDAYWGTLRSGAQGAMDLGIAKKIWNDQGEVKLRFGDILHTAGWKGENVFTPGLKMLANGNWESRIVALNFSYRFGSSEVKGARQRKTGLEEEGKRVKSGRN